MFLIRLFLLFTFIYFTYSFDNPFASKNEDEQKGAFDRLLDNTKTAINSAADKMRSLRNDILSKFASKSESGESLDDHLSAKLNDIKDASWSTLQSANEYLLNTFENGKERLNSLYESISASKSDSDGEINDSEEEDTQQSLISKLQGKLQGAGSFIGDSLTATWSQMKGKLNSLTGPSKENAEELDEAENEEKELKKVKAEKAKLEADEREQKLKVELEERQRAERLEKEEYEKALKEYEALEKERLEGERLELEAYEKERAEQENLERESKEEEKRAQAERLEQEKAEAERLEQEKAESERLERERLEHEQLEKEAIENERKEKERMVKEQGKQRQAEEAKKQQKKSEDDKEPKLTKNSRIGFFGVIFFLFELLMSLTAGLLSILLMGSYLYEGVQKLHKLEMNRQKL